MARIAYLSDVEGQWHKLEQFARDNPFVRLDERGELEVLGDAALVFGGDAVDRGPHAMRVIETLLKAKRRFPDQVVLLAGNRDLNKLRLVRELGGSPPAHAPRDVFEQGRPALLGWIFARTMGAPKAFEHRKQELAARGALADDEAVVASFLAELGPSGALTEYLSHARLAHRIDDVLFVHGSVTEANFGIVPESHERTASVDAWIEKLNAFHASSMLAFTRGDADGYRALVDYQAPRPGSHENPQSVVYGRPLDAGGQPRLPSRGVVEALARSGVQRLVVGHTPVGDCPAVLRDGDFTMILADNSYGRVEEGAQILLDGDAMRIRGTTELDSGERVVVDHTFCNTDPESPLGRLDVASQRLVKGRLLQGDWLVYRPLPNRKLEQQSASDGDILRMTLVAPRSSVEV